jgi:hypothetical protein
MALLPVSTKYALVLPIVKPVIVIDETALVPTPSWNPPILLFAGGPEMIETKEVFKLILLKT